MLNMCQISGLMTAAEGPVAEFSSFANFEERKRKSNLLMSFPKIVSQKGSFGQTRKKFVISLLSADIRYFRIYALKLLGLYSALDESHSGSEWILLVSTLGALHWAVEWKVPGRFYRFFDRVGANVSTYRPGTRWCNKCSWLLIVFSPVNQTMFHQYK